MHNPFHEQFTLASNGAGDGASELVWVKNVTDLTMQVAGTFTATLSVEGRLDPSLPWDPLNVQFTSADIKLIAGTYAQLRVVVSGYMSGSFVVHLMGRESLQR